MFGAQQTAVAPRSLARLSAVSRSGSRTLCVTTMAATAQKVAPAVIIGGGRVGFALEKMGDGEDVVRFLCPFPSAWRAPHPTEPCRLGSGEYYPS